MVKWQTPRNRKRAENRNTALKGIFNPAEDENCRETEKRDRSLANKGASGSYTLDNDSPLAIQLIGIPGV